MDRRERDRYDYGGDRDYRNDERYHSARNITNQFERDYQRERGGRWDDDRDRYSSNRSYHEGDMGGAYERMSREGGSMRGDSGYGMRNRGRDRDFSDNYNRDRDRYSNFQDDYRSYQGMNRGGRSSNRNQGGDMRRGYGISDYEGTSDRYNTLDSDRNRRGGDYYSGSGGSGYGGSRSGGGMGESFPHSHGGVPDYGTRNYGSGTGTGMGSTYGGKNYGGGTGYTSGHRGGSYGSSSYGTSSGNYGGYGSMGSGTYGGRGGVGGDTSHNSNRGTRELGGF